MLSACLLLWEGYRFILTDSRWTLPREFTPPTQRGSELHHLGQHHPGGETETQEEGICLRNQSKSAAQQGHENRPPDCDHVFFLLLQSTRGHGHARVLQDRGWPHLHCHRLGQYLSPGWLPASLSEPSSPGLCGSSLVGVLLAKAFCASPHIMEQGTASPFCRRQPTGSWSTPVSGTRYATGVRGQPQRNGEGMQLLSICQVQGTS